MLEAREVGRLLLEAPSQPGRPAYLAAASGLVAEGGRLYVVADDEVGLAIFDDAARAGRLEPFEPGGLPLDHDERKAAKPDLEALARLPGGALLALGSGATERRERGWTWREGRATELSLTGLYRRLREHVAELNIEGAAVSGDRLWLAQRGNGAESENVLVELDMARGLTPEAILSLVPYALGDVGGVPLTFSDLAPLPDGTLVFCAVAEDSGSTYHDGPCVGAGLGVVDPLAQRVTACERLAVPYKVEGATPAPEGGLLLVADGDDVEQPAPLLHAPMPD